MRLFVAIELSDTVRKSLVATQAGLKRKCPDVRWTQPEQLHLTVKFLGEVPESDVVAVSRAVSEAAAVSKAFVMQVRECGCFPERGAVRIVWVGARSERGALAECVAAVEAQVEPLGFPREHRPFAGHITIGRVREDRSTGAIRSAVADLAQPILEQDVSSLALMSSELSPRGSAYTVISRAKLGPE